MGSQVSKQATGDHFYTLQFKGELAAWSGYEREGVACSVYAIPYHGTVPVYRWYKHTDKIRDHIYTTDEGGELAPQSGYKYEGIAFYLFPKEEPDTVALNRWYHPQIGDHFYTTDPTGEAAPRAGYKREGVTGYVFKTNLRGSVELYRWYHSAIFNFTFDDKITQEQRQILYERHSWAYWRAGICTHLTPEQRDKVRTVYKDEIHHGISNTPNVNAETRVNARFININFNVLFPQDDNEKAMTLLHEMMHCAGYDHPVKGKVSSAEYFNAVPLKAELCIAGYASDAAATAFSSVQGEMAQDGSPLKKHQTPMEADEASKCSGCRLLGKGIVDRWGKVLPVAVGEPAVRAEAREETRGETVQPDSVARFTADEAEWHEIDPYKRTDGIEAVGLSTLLQNIVPTHST